MLKKKMLGKEYSFTLNSIMNLNDVSQFQGEFIESEKLLLTNSTSSNIKCVVLRSNEASTALLSYSSQLKDSNRYYRC